MSDALVLDAPRRTSDGYLAVRAKSARTGVYQYSGRDVDPDNAHGLRDQAIVHVLRDEKTVFDTAAVHSFIGKPITDDHPKEAVTASNWRDLSRGTIMGAMRDGDHLAFDLMLTDAGAIAKVDGGKRELSNGYEAGIEFGAFKAADGTDCQARQTHIRGNHIAIVDAGRAGPSCRIADAAHCDTAPQSFLDSLKPQETHVKTMLIDGLTVDISNADTALATINTILAARDAATGKIVTLETAAVTDAATIVAKDAEITKLTADLAAAKLTPAQMRDAGKAYALTAGKAKAMGVTVTDAMDEGAIMRAVVDKSMGDKAKHYSDEHVAIAFDALTKDAKVQTTDALRDAIIGQPVNVGDAANDRQKALDARRSHNATAFRAAAEA